MALSNVVSWNSCSLGFEFDACLEGCSGTCTSAVVGLVSRVGRLHASSRACFPFKPVIHKPTNMTKHSSSSRLCEATFAIDAYGAQSFCMMPSQSILHQPLSIALHESRSSRHCITHCNVTNFVHSLPTGYLNHDFDRFPPPFATHLTSYPRRRGSCVAAIKWATLQLKARSTTRRHIKRPLRQQSPLLITSRAYRQRAAMTTPR